MPFCKTCGSFYTKSLGICPTCNAEAVLREQPPANEAPPDNKERGRRWATICLGLPLLIALIYALYYIRMLIQK